MGKPSLSGKLLVYPVGGSRYIGNWIPNAEIVTQMEGCDIVVFPGGGDWNPKLYYDEKHSSTTFNSSIDTYQLKELLKALQLRKFIVGICRGHQMLHIAAGGKLIQNVQNHYGNHTIIDAYSNEEYTVNSVHHQMANLFSLQKDDYTLIAYADGLSSHYEGTSHYAHRLLSGKYTEPEVVYYPKLNGLGFQYHPESLRDTYSGLQYSINILNELYSMQADIRDDQNNFIIKRIETKIQISQDIVPSYGDTRFSFQKDAITNPYHSTCELPATCTKNNKNEENWLSGIKEL